MKKLVLVFRDRPLSKPADFRRLFYPEIRLKTAPFSPDVFFAFLLGMQNPRTNPRLASGEIQWGSDESGRDPVVSALLGRNPSAAKRGSLNW